MKKEDIQKYYISHKCELLELEYKNNKTLMRYRCKCGNEAIITFSSFRRGSRCIRCSIVDKKHTNEYAQKFFSDRECTLLDKYKNSYTLMNYICECGNKARIRFNDFQHGYRCQECKSRKLSGTNNYNYNSNITDEERQKNRGCPENRRWIKAIYKKNNYTCQKCGQYSGNLNAHNIYPYDIFKLLRTHIDNGITFCEGCHNNFHYQYGYNCNYSQLLEFLVQ